MKINGKIYHLKKGVKRFLLIIAFITLFVIIALLIHKANSNLKEEFKKCDEKMGYKCGFYEVHNYNRK